VSRRLTGDYRLATRSFNVIEGEEYLSPESQKALVNRLSKAEGHLRAVRNMILEQRCADEVLHQVAAVKAAVSQVAATILEYEMKSCVRDCMQGSDDTRLERALKSLNTILKQT